MRGGGKPQPCMVKSWRSGGGGKFTQSMDASKAQAVEVGVVGGR